MPVREANSTSHTPAGMANAVKKRRFRRRRGSPDEPDTLATPNLSGDDPLSDHQDLAESSDDERVIQRRARRAENIGPRRRIPQARATTPADAPAQEEARGLLGLLHPLFWDFVGDIGQMAGAGLRLLRALYPIGKWFLYGYLIWLACSYLLVYLYGRVLSGMSSVVCPIPVVSSWFPLCEAPIPTHPIDISKVATTQEELAAVMDQVGHGFDLARDMVGHEYAVRNLRIRVAASKLPRSQELTRELDSLIRYTKQVAKGLSRFTAKVGKSVDTAKTFDEWAVKALEGIAERQKNPPALPARVLSAIRPFAALDHVGPGETEERVKGILITTTTRIADKVKLLIEDSFDLFHQLDVIQEILDRINEIAGDEKENLPHHRVLSELWLRVAHPDDHEQFKSHEALLEDMTKFYDSSSNVMKETTASLNHIEAELNVFRDDFATPGLLLVDLPLEVVINLLRLSADRLEAGNSGLRRIEEGGRPQGGGAQKWVFTTIAAHPV